MSRDIPFESIVLHEPLGPVEAVVSERAVRRYCEDWEDPNPLYLEDSPLGGPVIPPAFLAGLTGFQLLGSRYNARATIGARTEHRSIAPARVGSTLITAGTLTEKYIRRGLEYVVVESTTRDQHGTEIRWSRDHILLGVERREPDASGPSERRAPRSEPRPEPVGVPIPELRKKAYQRALAERSFSKNSIHNDEYTRSQGYAGALMSAYVLCGYMSELAVNFCGPQWLRGGWLSLAFIGGGVQQGDAIRCGGVVTATAHEASGRARHELEIWMDKESGRRVIVGQASGPAAE